MQKWEYGVQTISLKPGVPLGLDLFTDNEDVILSYALDPWAEKGWELVALLPVDSTRVRAVFKKPIENPKSVGGIMAIDMKLTDREVVIFMTLCDLLGKPVTMSATEDACERSVERVNRETAQLLDDQDSEV